MAIAHVIEHYLYLLQSQHTITLQIKLQAIGRDPTTFYGTVQLKSNLVLIKTNPFKKISNTSCGLVFHNMLQMHWAVMFIWQI